MHTHIYMQMSLKVEPLIYQFKNIVAKRLIMEQSAAISTDRLGTPTIYSVIKLYATTQCLSMTAFYFKIDNKN